LELREEIALRRNVDHQRRLGPMIAGENPLRSPSAAAAAERFTMTSWTWSNISDPKDSARPSEQDKKISFDALLN
jgi:hypothetical protein